MNEDLRKQICDWLRVNDIDPNMVPVDTTTTLGERWLGVDIYPPGPDGNPKLAPDGQVHRETRRFALRVPPDGPVLDWLRRDQGAHSSSR